MNNKTKNYLKEAVNIFVPPTCCVCGEELRSFEKNFCTECFASLPFSQFWKYEDNPAEEVFKGKVPIKGAVPLLLYKGPVREAVHDFKYHSSIGIGEELGELLGEVICASPRMKEALKDGVTIVPVPLHPRKKRKRGYNQSEVIARAMKRGIEKTIARQNEKGTDEIICGEIAIEPKLLKRKKFTGTQTALGKLDRYNNIQNAFGVNEKKMKRFCSKKKRKK